MKHLKVTVNLNSDEWAKALKDAEGITVDGKKASTLVAIPVPDDLTDAAAYEKVWKNYKGYGKDGAITESPIFQDVMIAGLKLMARSVGQTRINKANAAAGGSVKGTGSGTVIE